MRRLVLFTAIMICMTCAAPLSQADQLKTGIMKTAPAPNQITGTPTPQAPAVKTAPKVTAPVPTKQGLNAPLGQKATIAVKSPAQGTRHPADKPLTIVWDRSAIPAAATVNIILVDKPGGTAKATIKAGAPNTGSFTSWIAPQQYTAAGNSWAVRIETADSKASGHSGVFSFQPPTPPMVNVQKTFDQSEITIQMKQMLESKMKQIVAVHQLNPSTETRLKMCKQQSKSLSNALAECLKTSSDPINPPPGSPLDSFNKLTNAQLAQQCPGSLQQCLDKVIDEHVAWCKANICKSQVEALSAMEVECSKLQALLDQEKSQPPSLKKNTPPCPELYQNYIKARQAVDNFECGLDGVSALGCISPFQTLLEAERDALKKLEDNGCL
jgi:hypothetical protein